MNLWKQAYFIEIRGLVEQQLLLLYLVFLIESISMTDII